MVTQKGTNRTGQLKTEHQPKEESVSTTYLPYIGGILKELGNIHRKKNFRVVDKPLLTVH